MICIVGADGFFGAYMQKHILSYFPFERLLCLNHRKAVFSECENKTDMNFELENAEDIKRTADFLSKQSDIKIFYTSCVHNPDAIRKNPSYARHINCECYENFLENLKGLDITRLVYTSSDTVYGESENGHAFCENDTPNPVNEYGRQKLCAEKITEKYGFCNARYSYLFSLSATPEKKHFADFVFSTLKEGKSVDMLTDWVRNPLTYQKAADITCKMLMCGNLPKTVNVCGDKAMSKYDMGIEVAKHLEVPTSLVVPCTSDTLGVFFEKRADKLLCDNTLMKRLLNTEKAEFEIEE